jgi:hypothetical protein
MRTLHQNCLKFVKFIGRENLSINLQDNKLSKQVICKGLCSMFLSTHQSKGLDVCPLHSFFCQEGWEG